MTTQWMKLMIVLVTAGAVAFAGCVQEEEATGDEEGMGDTGAGGDTGTGDGGLGNDTTTESEDGIGEPSTEGIGTDGMQEETAVTPAGQ